MAIDLLIGRGLLGHALADKHNFSLVVDSKNAADAREGRFDTVFIAAMPGTKWRANTWPDSDLRSLQNLLVTLGSITAKAVVLVSTVDVFPQPAWGDERREPDPDTAYGWHRLLLEHFVRSTFRSSLIVRLPAIVSEAVKKGPLYDIANNDVGRLCGDSRYQWYVASRLYDDCKQLLAKKVELAHLVSPPLLMSRLCRADQMRGEVPASYDIKTINRVFRPQFVPKNYWSEVPYNEIVLCLR